MNLNIGSPTFVHRIWECAGTDLLGVFSFDRDARDFAQFLADRGREPQKTILVVTNSYDGQACRICPAQPEKVAS